uniref:Uncharacterized protein n=1 Tax=Gallus gallus TaxID=9031 RepID=A0A8V1AD78_CHICK
SCTKASHPTSKLTGRSGQYWLPPGATWEDMKESADTHYPKPQDLWLCLPGALLLIVVRCIFERWVAQIQLLLSAPQP